MWAQCVVLTCVTVSFAVCVWMYVCMCSFHCTHGAHPHTSDFFFSFKLNRWIIEKYVSYRKTSSQNFNVVYLYMRKNWQMYKLVSSLFMLSNSLMMPESTYLHGKFSLYLVYVGFPSISFTISEFSLNVCASFPTTHCAYNARTHIICFFIHLRCNRITSNRIKVWMIQIAMCTNCHASVRFLSLHRRICNNSLHCLRMICVYIYPCCCCCCIEYLVSVSHKLFSVFVFNSTTRFQFIPDFFSYSFPLFLCFSLNAI